MKKNQKVESIKTYVLMISRTFPAYHQRKGEQTYFADKILKQYSDFNNFLGWQKIHTIRNNYKLWKKRIEKIQAGKAVLSVRYWSGSPYNFKKDNSKQIEFLRLDKDSGIGIQLLKFCDQDITSPMVDYFFMTYKYISVEDLAKNDGLSFDDFEWWFEKYDLSEPMGIIHFTDFRYY